MKNVLRAPASRRRIGVFWGLVAAGAVGVILLLTSCSKALEPWNDAPRGATDESPARIIAMPDGFNNVAAKCDGPNMVYTLFHRDSPYGAVAVAPNDPRCKA